MRVELETQICGLDGTHLIDGDGPLTLKRVCINALLNQFPGDNETGEDKLRRFQLAKKMNERQSLELSAEAIAELKQRIARGYGPLVCGQSWELLDPPTPKVTRGEHG